MIFNSYEQKQSNFLLESLKYYDFFFHWSIAVFLNYFKLTTHPLKFFNARLKGLCVVSMLSAGNGDIRFEPTLVIISTKNNYGLIFDRSPFLKIFSQVLSKSNVFVESWHNWHKSAVSFAGTTNSNKNKAQFYCKYNWTSSF